ncbi:MAG: homoserine dehydrogenase [Deltaproteobacteria bacterium]|nr:homoserine dehydrogenase [Deltaproteobacteria bacterium]
MKTVRIGLFGCGVVGSELCRLVRDTRDLFERRDGIRFEIAAVGVAHPGKPRPEWVPADRIVAGWNAVAAMPGIDVVVELIGGTGDAKDAVFDSLGRCRHTVTANKALLAQSGVELTRLAASKGCGLCFEAAVGGGVPVIASVAETLNANRFHRVAGIVNGTTNFILTRMKEEGMGYDQALLLAQERGFAEPDASFDVEGTDAAQKLSILAALAFGAGIPAHEIYTEGITRVTAQDMALVAGFDYVIKLLAIGRRTPHGVELRVHPALVNSRHPLAAVRDEFNAFFLTGDVTGEVMLYGKGAGPSPAAGAVLSDVARLARREGTSWFDRQWTYDDIEHVPIGDVETGYYMIFPVVDKPGVIGRIASTLGSYGINIESAHAHLPEPRNGHGLVQIISHRARERDVRGALKAVRDLPVLTGEAWFYRIEE